jgi:uncharacterized SAM-binding protein YcdF (DUF218 family)
MKIDEKKLARMFEYLRSHEHSFEPVISDGAFVFCRNDPLVALTAAQAYKKHFLQYVMFTGGIGKDSGALARINIPDNIYQGDPSEISNDPKLLRWNGIPEAVWLGTLAANQYGVDAEKIHLETRASNGGENCRLGIDLIVKRELAHNHLLVVAHATSLRRVVEMLSYISKEKNFHAKLLGMPTDYAFKPYNPADQREAVDELLRLYEWPLKGQLHTIGDLPMDLVEYALELRNARPK